MYKTIVWEATFKDGVGYVFGDQILTKEEAALKMLAGHPMSKTYTQAYKWRSKADSLNAWSTS